MDNPAYGIRVTTSMLVHAGPCILYRVRPQVATAGNYVSVYDGMDATSGELKDKIVCDVNVPTSADYGPGLYFSRGLFVAIGSSGDAALVTWRPCDLQDVE